MWNSPPAPSPAAGGSQGPDHGPAHAHRHPAGGIPPLYGKALSLYERVRDAQQPGVVSDADLDTLSADQRHQFFLTVEHLFVRHLDAIEAQIAELEQTAAVATGYWRGAARAQALHHLAEYHRCAIARLLDEAHEKTS